MKREILQSPAHALEYFAIDELENRSAMGTIGGPQWWRKVKAQSDGEASNRIANQNTAA